MNWEDQKTVQKGNIGEMEVSNYFAQKGYIVYKPENGGAHPFDKLIARKDKREIFIAEVKTKARRSYYPDTGIDIRHYEGYCYITQKHNMELFIYFVDELMEKIYGNTLKKLKNPIKIEYEYETNFGNKKHKTLKYPLKEKGIIYFPLKNMIKICELSSEQVKILKKLNQRSYVYSLPLNEKVTILNEEKNHFKKLC